MVDGVANPVRMANNVQDERKADIKNAISFSDEFTDEQRAQWGTRSKSECIPIIADFTDDAIRLDRSNSDEVKPSGSV